jgi:hypothetical protein
MQRREFITLLGAAGALPIGVRAQSAGMLRVGMVGSQPRSSPLYAAFLQRLAELGYQEGSNFTFEFIQAVNLEEYARGHRELVTRNVGILVASGAEVALKSALAATDTLPIVMTAIDYDPLALGYVKAWRGRAATSLASSFSRSNSRPSGCKLSRMRFPICAPRPCSGIGLRPTNGGGRKALRRRSDCGSSEASCTNSPTITNKHSHRRRPIIAAGCS